MQAILFTTKNGTMGVDGSAPWYDKRQQRDLHALTIGAKIVVGRVTYQMDLPWLRKRRVVVLSRRASLAVRPGDWVCTSPKQVVADHEDAWVVGGSMTLRIMMPHIQHLYWTQLNLEAPGDVQMPDIAWSMWNMLGRSDLGDRTLQVYTRRNLAKTAPRPDSAAASKSATSAAEKH